MGRVKRAEHARGGPNPIWIANWRDDLWVGVKCQANPEIAGSPRNVFRCSLAWGAAEVAQLDRRGGLPLTNPNQTTNAVATCTGVRLRVRRFVVERETAQTAG